MNKLVFLLLCAIPYTTYAGDQLDFRLSGKAKPIYGPKQESAVERVGDTLTFKGIAFEFGPSPEDAIAYTLSDLARVAIDDRPFQRYIWNPTGEKLNEKAVNWGVNLSISKATPVVWPVIGANGKIFRYDLRHLVPLDNQDLGKLIGIYERLQFEPYFHLVDTSDNALPTNAIQIDSVDSDPFGSKRFQVGETLWYKSPNNIFFSFIDGSWKKKQAQKVVKIAAYGSHVGINQATLLAGQTKSNASIQRYDFFLVKILSELNGGLYYDFAGIEPNPSKGTAQDAFLRSVGANEKLVQEIRSDQRAAIFRSKVTGKPRRIDLFRGQSRSGTGLVTVTHDITDEDIDPAQHPIRNLLEFKDAAREIIAEKNNGLHLFGLFDGKGNLQESAPDNVVKDHTIPPPHTARLQPAISCIRCHGPDDGLKPFDNDVKKMLRGLLDVFDDLSSKNSVPDTLDRLAGLYAGDMSKAIRRGKDDYSDATFRATRGLSVKEVSAVVTKIYNTYVYDEIDAHKACEELGFIVREEDAVKFLNYLLPPLQRDIVGISPEDPIIGALKAGLTINRFEWEQVYFDAAFRASQTKKQLILPAVYPDLYK